MSKVRGDSESLTFVNISLFLAAPFGHLVVDRSLHEFVRLHVCSNLLQSLWWYDIKSRTVMSSKKHAHISPWLRIRWYKSSHVATTEVLKRCKSGENRHCCLFLNTRRLVLTSKRSKRSLRFLKSSRHVGWNILCWSSSSYMMKSTKVICWKEKLYQLNTASPTTYEKGKIKDHTL